MFSLPNGKGMATFPVSAEQLKRYLWKVHVAFEALVADDGTGLNRSN